MVWKKEKGCFKGKELGGVVSAALAYLAEKHNCRQCINFELKVALDNWKDTFAEGPSVILGGKGKGSQL